jgi:hypothetical protein
MSPSVISKRKSGLEKWIQHALTFPIFESKLKVFLEIPSEVISKTDPIDKLNDDEVLIKEFTSSISSSPHSKTNIIDSFDKKFFSKRRNIRETYIHLLLNTVVPLCSDEYIGSKALYVLYKLCNSVNFRDFDTAIKELSKLSAGLLSCMKLNDYLLKRRFCDGEIQAFHILKEIRPYFDDQSFLIVLNQDLEAEKVFKSWVSGGCIAKPQNEISSNSEWRSLAGRNEDISIKFRFVNKELEFLATFNVESDIQTVAELIIVPGKRKLWDLNLEEMEEVKKNHDDRCLRLLYSHQRSFFEFHNSVSVSSSLFSCKIQFKSKNFSCVQPKGTLGRLTSLYKLENVGSGDKSFVSSPGKEVKIKRTSSNGDLLLEELEKKQASIKVTWQSTFCENSKKMLISDCFQETDLVSKTFSRFLEVAESRSNDEIRRNPSNSIWQACERKKLRQLTNMRKISSPEDFKEVDLAE